LSDKIRAADIREHLFARVAGEKSEESRMTARRRTPVVESARPESQFPAVTDRPARR